jgi:hypothetical protein
MNIQNRDQEAARALLNCIAGNPARLITTTAVIWVEIFLAHWCCVIYAPPGHLPERGFAVFGSAIAASMVAGLAGAALWLHYQRQKTNTRHAWQVLQLNHHVRNAMQVIAYSQTHLPKPQADTMIDALNRIGEALRAISSEAEPVEPQRAASLSRFPTFARSQSVEQIETAFPGPADSKSRVRLGSEALN